ncbi:MAG TPA: SUMF1/EgtB/PvdO family nonheme iron enzyme [Polyangium sp.]|nr:SUMF1/EgtB/PvdO family nonheme iron enzyme [Polyangium sp.]
MTLADGQRKLFGAVGFVLGAMVFGLVIRAALDRAAPPSRCAAGMVLLGPRCCGTGQTLAGQQCVGRPAACAQGLNVTERGCVAPNQIIYLPGGTLRIGPGDWEAQGQVIPQTIEVPAFSMDAHEVHELRYGACIAAGACAAVELSGEPGRALGGVTLDEAARFCAWAGGALPTAEQLAFAAAGVTGRRYAWGETGAVCRRAAWGLVRGPCGEGATGPELTGSHPDGVSPEGIFDLAGNVAEWAAPANVEAKLVDVRGGSFADGAASALRSWHRREMDRTTRAVDIGWRCAYAAEKARGR